MSLQVALQTRALSQHLLDVRTLRSSSDHNRFWWMVRNDSGQLIATSSTTYATHAEARRAADSVARTIRRHPWAETLRNVLPTSEANSAAR